MSVEQWEGYTMGGFRRRMADYIGNALCCADESTKDETVLSAD